MQTYSFAKITVRPFLKLSDVNNPYIFGETKHVINMCAHREPEVIDLIHSKGGTFDWFPTEEQPMDVNAILQAVAKLAEYDKDGTPIIVHCMGGNNRSRTVVEAYHFAKTGTHLEDEYKDQFAKILETTKLKNVISTLQLIEDRLQTIQALRAVNFDHTLKAGEVKHLQKLIESHYWIFGEEYRFVGAENVKFQEALNRYK